MTTDPDKQIADVPNLGPVTARLLAEIDVFSFGDLVALGAVEAYARLRFRHGRRVTRNALHALEAAIRGTDWRRLGAADKAALDAAVALRTRARPSA